MLRYFAGVSVVAVAAMSSSVHAQEGAVPENSKAEQTAGIQDIIVTAQRRAENVQKSSLAIQVVSSEELERAGVVSAKDLASVVPGVQVTQAGPFTQTYIRGIGDYSVNGFAQLAISYNIDGVNIDRAVGIAPNFYDLARVEVLKGPQGTLYGRNATGGAVNLITNRPKNEFEGYLTGEYGNYDALKLAGAINVPLGQTLAARFAFQVINRDGYLSDGTDDHEQQAGRLQLLWEPNPNISLRISGDYAHQGGQGAGSVLWPRQGGTGSWTSVTDPINAAVRAAASGGLATPLPTTNFLNNKLWNLSAELNVKLGDFATLTAIPAYRGGKMRQRSHTIGMVYDTPHETFDQTSFEARLGNQTDALKWVAGVYYFNIDSASRFLVNASEFIPGYHVDSNFPEYNIKSYAGFGEATLSVTDALRVIGGIRYTHEKNTISGRYIDRSIHNAFDFPITGAKSKNAVTWKGGLEYDAGPASMLFATVSKGFKSGGFFRAPSPDNSYGPESLLDFTIGSRNRFYGNTLQINLEAFYWRYRDQQTSNVGFTNSGFITLVTRNVGASNPYGADLDLVYKPTPSDTFNAAVGYIRAKYSNFKVNYPTAFIGGLYSACGIGAASTTGFPTTEVDCSGFPLARTPKWSGSASYQHEFLLPEDATVTTNLSMTFASSRYLSIDYFTPESKTGGYALLNASITYRSGDERLSLTGFVRNITNNAVYIGSQAFIFNGRYQYRTIAAPRTYGVTATVKF